MTWFGPVRALLGTYPTGVSVTINMNTRHAVLDSTEAVTYGLMAAMNPWCGYTVIIDAGVADNAVVLKDIGGATLTTLTLS